MPKILLISHDTLLPADSGGRQRSALIYKALSEIGQVDTLVIDMYRQQRSADVLAAMRERYRMRGLLVPALASDRGVWRYLKRFNPNAVQRIAHNADQIFRPYSSDPTIADEVARLIRQEGYDLIVSRYLGITALAGVLRFSNLIVDVDDLDSEIYAAKARLPDLHWWERLMLRAYAHRFRQLERRILCRFATVFVAKVADTKYLGLDNLYVVPNIPFHFPEEKDLDLDWSSSNVILFVGTLNWPRNQEAVDYFLLQVWPLIRRDRPLTVFRLVGKANPIDRARWSAVAGVEVLGYVELLAEAYRQAALTVAPILGGGGTNIKLLESLAYGRTCVAFTHALRGFDDVLIDGESVLVADDAAAMANHCVALLEHPQHARAMGRRGRIVVNRHYSYPQFSSVVKETARRFIDAKVALMPNEIPSTSDISLSLQGYQEK